MIDRKAAIKSGAILVMNAETSADLLALTADIVSSHVRNNSVSVSDLPSLIHNVHSALTSLGGPVAEIGAVQEPAVAIRSSVKNDYIVCLEDGKKLKILKRHLRTHYQMTPDQYRAKWKLTGDYPMVAPAYAATRKALALKIGLGHKRAVETPKEVEPKVAKSVTAGIGAARTHLGVPDGKALAKATRKPRTAKADPAAS
jgi:predicted transcriptional regulator